MRLYRFSWILTIFFFIGTEEALTQEAVDQDRIEKCAELVDSLMQIHRIPGLAVTVSVGDRIIWSEGFGYANLEARSPVYPSVTMFRIGSISKTLTSVALARLYEQGKISLDSTVQTYVPSFPEKKYPITVEQVAGHIAGIRHYRGLEFLNKRRYQSVRSGLNIFKNDSLLFEPGSQYTYSSYGWNLISAVIENASGVEFLDYMADTIFRPLGMRKTLPDYHEDILVGRTGFYMKANNSWINAPFVDNSYKWAGGGFLSTAHDLIRFGQAQLRNACMTERTFEKWTTSLQTNDGELTDYGIGWRLGEDSLGRDWVGHSGGSAGGTSRMMIYPDSGLVVVILTNISQAPLKEMADGIAVSFP